MKYYIKYWRIGGNNFTSRKKYTLQQAKEIVKRVVERGIVSRAEIVHIAL